MLVILFMNVVAPLIDYPLVRANIKRRAQRRADTRSTRYTIVLRDGGLRRLRAAGRGVGGRPARAAGGQPAPLPAEERAARGGPGQARATSCPTQELQARLRRATSACGSSISRPASCSPTDRMDAEAPTTSARRAATRRASHAAPPNAGADLAAAELRRRLLRRRHRATRAIEQVVIPVEGVGMWGTLYGFLAIDRDTTTIRGLTYYDQKETPGLGGEIGNRAVAGAVARPQGLRRELGAAGSSSSRAPPGRRAQDPQHVDGLSGATITSNGITRLMAFWLWQRGLRPVPRRSSAKERRRELRSPHVFGKRAARHAARRRSSPTTRSACRCSASARRSRSPRASTRRW